MEEPFQPYLHSILILKHMLIDVWIYFHNCLYSLYIGNTASAV